MSKLREHLVERKTGDYRRNGEIAGLLYSAAEEIADLMDAIQDAIDNDCLDPMFTTTLAIKRTKQALDKKLNGEG